MVQVLALIGLVGECQLSQLLPGRGGVGGSYKERRGLGSWTDNSIKVGTKKIRRER